MKRLIALLVLAAVALVPAAASAKSRAKVYRGTFDFVGADGSYVTGKFGRVQLVDNRNHDKLTVHVRRLASRAKYVFRLQVSSEGCEEGAGGGANVEDWHYRRGGVLKTNRKGVANGSAWSRKFMAQRSLDYIVVVYERMSGGSLGPVVLCAELNRKSTGSSKGKSKHKGQDKSRGKSDDAPRGNANGQDKDDNGKSEDAPGHNKEEGENRATGRGQEKSDDKPKGKKSRR